MANTRLGSDKYTFLNHWFEPWGSNRMPYQRWGGRSSHSVTPFFKGIIDSLPSVKKNTEANMAVIFIPLVCYTTTLLFITSLTSTCERSGDIKEAWLPGNKPVTSSIAAIYSHSHVLCHGAALCYGVAPCHRATPCHGAAPCHRVATCHRATPCHEAAPCHRAAPCHGATPCHRAAPCNRAYPYLTTV